MGKVPVKEEWVESRLSWNRDDDVKSMELGFVICGEPLDLVCTIGAFHNHAEPRIFETMIKARMLEDPFMFKAYVTLIKSKADNPNHKFRFDGS